jgi:hypothetical protein
VLLLSFVRSHLTCHKRSLSRRGLGILHLVPSLLPHVSTPRRRNIRIGSYRKRIGCPFPAFAEILQSHDLHRPVKINTQIDGQDAYATSDLLVPHPTKSGLWKIYGRKDDQIMLSTGEKTNPGPLGMVKYLGSTMALSIKTSVCRGHSCPGSSHTVCCHVWQG